MNERQLRSAYVLGIAASAYALWYFVASSANLLAAGFGLVTVLLLIRLRRLIADS
ncbi:hypothetical protein [Natrinema halophilum]|uniref:Uncharacterized protein n=1 Tax=Natrinema halophilum TaxID=1699371 RepID=A0A7D5GJC2_9EURY|nr:hypothetical protein [Natrinema halophilum]QLG50588.1 hypothetical protein HYG82_17930 [Natrinema halophilum]